MSNTLPSDKEIKTQMTQLVKGKYEKISSMKKRIFWRYDQVMKKWFGTVPSPDHVNPIELVMFF